MVHSLFDFSWHLIRAKNLASLFCVQQCDFHLLNAIMHPVFIFLSSTALLVVVSTGNPSTLSALKINVLLLTCVPVFFESFRRDLIMNEAKSQVSSNGVNY